MRKKSRRLARSKKTSRRKTKKTHSLSQSSPTLSFSHFGVLEPLDQVGEAPDVPGRRVTQAAQERAGEGRGHRKKIWKKKQEKMIFVFLRSSSTSSTSTFLAHSLTRTTATGRTSSGCPLFSVPPLLLLSKMSLRRDQQQQQQQQRSLPVSGEGERGERGGRRKGEEVEPREREQELTFSTPPPFKRSTARRRGIPRVPREAAREWKREREEEEKERRRREQNARGPFFAAASPLFLKKNATNTNNKTGLARIRPPRFRREGRQGER